MKKIFPTIGILVITLSTSITAQEQRPMNENFALVIHGGAGTILKKNMTEEKETMYREKLSEALNKGHEILKSGGTSTDCVEAVIRIMEDSPLFNAGKGAVFTNAGTNEMDASMMEGKMRNAGAVAGVKTVRNPITAARLVMEKSPHVMLSGEGADQFAKENGLKTEGPEYFRDEVRYQQWQRVKEKEDIKLDHDPDDRGGYQIVDSSEIEFNINLEPPDDKYGTVGAVALDQHGNITAGTSTGGMTNKRWGRIGDSPIIAAGTYANNRTCGISSTGHGEYFIRGVVAYDISALMEYKGLSVDEAAKEVVHKKLKELGGSGGVIGLDARGNITMQFNTPGMYRGYVKRDGKIEIGIYKD